MEKEQELEWKAAQSTEISVDLVSAAERQLKFLAAVDRNRWLYEGPGLDRAIYRQETDLRIALLVYSVFIDLLMLLSDH